MFEGYTDVHESLWERSVAEVGRSEAYPAEKQEILRIIAGHLVYMGWKGPEKVKDTSEVWVLDALYAEGLLRSEQLDCVIRCLELKVRNGANLDVIAESARRLVTEMARQRGLRAKEAADAVDEEEHA